jgi:hypothetical protein
MSPLPVLMKMGVTRWRWGALSGFPICSPFDEYEAERDLS